MNSGLLIVLSGLPGVGKTTISKGLAKRLHAVYLRIDTIEQALLKAEEVTSLKVGGEGYYIAVALAKENLKAGNIVIADSVNPEEFTRELWRTALEPESRLLEIEIICSDKAEHKQRIERRISDIVGHKRSTWKDVIKREYYAWDTASLIIDTAKTTVETAVEIILKQISVQ